MRLFNCQISPLNISQTDYSKNKGFLSVLMPSFGSFATKEDGPKHVEEMLTRDHFEDAVGHLCRKRAQLKDIRFQSLAKATT